MPRTHVALITLGLFALIAVSGLAAPSTPRSVQSRARASEQVIVATVAAVSAVYETNEFGDRLIVSKARLRVLEALKGPKIQELEVDVEGGTVGDITLTVSDLPSLAQGERAVFFVAKNGRGRLVPHLRGQSILKLDSQDRIDGSSVSLTDVRAAVRGAR